MAEDTAEDLQEETLEDQDENDGAAEDAEEEKESEEEEVVPVRKNVVSAQRRIIEKQRKELDKKEEELTPQAQALIEKQLEPLKKQIGTLSDELSFRDYFRDHPEDRKFEKQARARFDAWNNVPIEEILKTLRQSSSEDKQSAEEKAKRGRIGGSSKRSQEGEGIAKTEAELKKVYQDRRSGKISSGEVLKKLGISE